MKMFYPEFSPAMKWHLEQNQKIYSNFMFNGHGGGQPTSIGGFQKQHDFDSYHGKSFFLHFI